MSFVPVWNRFTMVSRRFTMEFHCKFTISFIDGFDDVSSGFVSSFDDGFNSSLEQV